jgi:hypothetical protein
VANTRPSINKRRREVARKERKQAKAERRAQRSADRQNRAPTPSGGEDPDIAGIKPGPQPIPWEEFAPIEPEAEESETEEAEEDA